MESAELSRLIVALKRQRDRIDDLKPLNSAPPDYKAWRTITIELVRRADISQFIKDFDALLYRRAGILFLDETEQERLARERPHYLEKLETARALLTSLIETLEELAPTLSKPEVSVEDKTPEEAPALTVNVSVVNQIVNQLAVQSNFVLLADEIKALPLTNGERAEGSRMLKELEQEIQSGSPKWDRIRTIIKWLIDHAWEVFVKVTPYLLEAYAKSRGVT